MIDRTELKSLGWSDDLIDAALQVANSIPEDVCGEVVSEGVDLQLVDASSVVSAGTDVSGPPIGATRLILLR